MNKKVKNLIITVAIAVAGLLSTAVYEWLFERFQDRLFYNCLQYIVPLLFIFFISGYFGYNKYYKLKGGICKSLFYGMPVAIVIVVNVFLALVPMLGKESLLPDFGHRLFFLFLEFVLVAFFEESLFRNVIVHRLLDSGYSKVATIYISSLMFGLFHLGNLTNGEGIVSTMTQVVYTFMLGVLLSSIYIKYKSLYAVMFLHFILDFSSGLTTLFAINANAGGDLNLISALVTILVMTPSFIVGIIVYKKKD